MAERGLCVYTRPKAEDVGSNSLIIRPLKLLGNILGEEGTKDGLS